MSYICLYYSPVEACPTRASRCSCMMPPTVTMNQQRTSSKTSGTPMTVLRDSTMLHSCLLLATARLLIILGSQGCSNRCFQDRYLPSNNRCFQDSKCFQVNFPSHMQSTAQTQ